MKMKILLASLPFLFPLAVSADETKWTDHLKQADDLVLAEKADHASRGMRVIVALRRAWVALPDNNLDDPAFSTLRKKLIHAYKNMSLFDLAKWYENQSIAEIDKKIRENAQKGKTFYKEDWHARMDEFGMITIWKLDSIKPQQQPTVLYYKHGDEMYSDAFLLSGLTPKEEKPVDFDLSSFVYVGGPTFGKGNQIDW